MKKILLIGTLLIISSILFSLDLIDAESTYTIDKIDLEKFERIKLTTHRDKDGEEKNDNWIGVKLTDILDEYNISNYDKLCFISADNYLVRVNKEDLLSNEGILALVRNGKPIEDENIRLVIPAIRDMFWIQDIITIKTEMISDTPFPHTIFFAEPILQKTQIRNELPPFVKVTGYTFTEIMDQAFPFLKDEVLVVGKDGVKHSLDYHKYLKNAILIKNEDSFDLKSPDMPAGMWIKNLAYIQIFDVAVIFHTRFSNLKDLHKLLSWKNFPESITIFNENGFLKLSSDLSLNNKVWIDVQRLEW